MTTPIVLAVRIGSMTLTRGKIWEGMLMKLPVEREIDMALKQAEMVNLAFDIILGMPMVRHKDTKEKKETLNEN